MSTDDLTKCRSMERDRELTTRESQGVRIIVKLLVCGPRSSGKETLHLRSGSVNMKVLLLPVHVHAPLRAGWELVHARPGSPARQIFTRTHLDPLLTCGAE